MSIHDCGAPLSRRLVKTDGAWELELRNNHETETVHNVHVVSIFFRDDGKDGKSNIQITFDENIAAIAPQETAIPKHRTHLYNEYHTGPDDMWIVVDARNDRILRLTEEAAKTPIGLDVQFEMNETNCYQELGAGLGSGLHFPRG